MVSLHDYSVCRFINADKMKRILLIIGCCLTMVCGLSAQTLEQKKICALKWTLQQAFYNKSEGQQIARLNVTEFKSFGDFQKDKVVSAAIKKITDATEQSRVNRIINATSASDVDASVPSGASKEYKADVEKIKAQGTASDGDGDEEESGADQQAEPQQPSSTTPDIQPVEETASDDTAEQSTGQDSTDGDNADAVAGLSFWEAALVSFVMYIVLTICLLVFIRSRRNAHKTEESVTMEQYRTERLRLIERIKAAEIEIDNIKAARKEKKSATATVAAKATVEPVKPVVTEAVEPQKKETAVNTVTTEKHNPVPQTLFSETEPQLEVKVQPQQEKHQRPKNYSSVMFYPIPVDGVFMNGCSEIEVGTSLYMLKTNDDTTATFQILNTPEAISAALVSMDTMVKPACKILNTVASPVEILAEKLGTAEKVDGGWKITNKAVVRLI